jgi:hypothetical protein
MNDKNLQDIKDTVTDAGKALLAYSKTGAAFLPFDGDLYVAVGTLASIAHVAGKSMDEAAPAAQAQAELTDERIDQLWRHSCDVGGDTTQQFTRHFAKAIAREVRLSAVREHEPSNLVADLSEFTERSIREHADFRDDIERLSTADSRTRKALRKEIYDTIDARVRNAVKAALSRCSGAAVREARNEALNEAASLADKVADGYCESQSGKWPELRDDAETGARSCAEQIRALKAASKEGDA